MKIDKMILQEIWYGYSTLVKSWFGYWDNEVKAEHDRKAKICTKECPLYGKYFGVIPMCDASKTHEGEEGCGCVRAAKLWSESECPLGKF